MNGTLNDQWYIDGHWFFFSDLVSYNDALKFTSKTRQKMKRERKS